MTSYQVIICVLLSWALLSQARGTLFVNSVYSSSEKEIVIDNLRGVDVGTGSGKIPVGSMNLTAPQLNLQGSFVSIAQEKDLLFRSSEWNITLQGGSDLDTKSKLLNLFGNQIDIKAPRGDIRFRAKNQISLTAQNINLQVEHGGIDFESVAGSLTISGEDRIDFYGKQSFLVDVQHEDIYITSQFNSTFQSSEGGLLLFCESIMNFDSTLSLTIQSESIEFQTDSMTLTTLGWNAMSTSSSDEDLPSTTGGGEASLESISNEIRLIGYEGVFFDAEGQLEIQGRGSGVSFSLIGEESQFKILSTMGSIEYSTFSSTETSQIALEAHLVEISLSEDFSIQSGEDTFFHSDSTLKISSPEGLFSSKVGLDLYFQSRNDLSYASGTTFTVLSEKDIQLGDSSHNGRLGTWKDSLSPDGREISVSIQGALVTHNAPNGTLTLSVDDLSVRAKSGIRFRAGQEIEIRNSFGETLLQGNEFLVHSQRDLYLQGGSVFLEGQSSEYLIGTDWKLKSNQESSSLLDFHSNIAQWNVEHLKLQTSHSLLDGSASHIHDSNSPIPEVSMVEILGFQQVEVSSGDFADLLMKTEQLSSLIEDGDLFYQSRVHSKIVSSTQSVLFQSGLPGTHLQSGTSFSGESKEIRSRSMGNTSIRSDGARVHFHTSVDEPTDGGRVLNDDFLLIRSLNQTLMETEKIFFQSDEQTLFSGKEFVAQSQGRMDIHSGWRQPISLSANIVQVSMTDELSLRGQSVQFHSERNLLVSGDELLGLHASHHGVNSLAEGTLSMVALTNLTMVNMQEIFIHSQEQTSFIATNEKFLSKSGGDWKLHSHDGSIRFLTGGIPDDVNPNPNPNPNPNSDTRMEFEFQGNLTVAAGSSSDDLLSVKSNSLSFLSNKLNMDVLGVLRFDVGGNLEFDAKEGVHFQIGNGFLIDSPELITEIGQSGLTLWGGNVNFTSTLTETRFSAGLLIAMNSTDVSVASKELDQAKDGLFFHSKQQMSLNSLSNVVLFARDSISIQTGSEESTSDGSLSPGGPIVIEGNSVDISSGATNPEFENQHIQITSGKEGVFFHAQKESEYLFDRDLSIHGGKSAKFIQSELLLSVEDSFSMVEQLGKLFINSTGSNVEFESGTSRSGTLFVHGTDLGHFQAGEKIVILSEGTLRDSSTTPRRGSSFRDHRTRPIGMLFTSEDSQSDILFQATGGEFRSESQGGNTEFSGKEISIRTKENQQFVAAKISVDSQNDLVSFQSGNGIQIEGGDRLDIQGERIVELIAAGKLSVLSASDWVVSSNSKETGISLKTLQEDHSILINTQNDVSVLGGTTVQVEASGSLVLSASKEWSVQGGHGGVSIGSTTEGQTGGKAVVFQALGTGSEIRASGQIHLVSEGDGGLVLSVDQNPNSVSGTPLFQGGQIQWTSIEGDIRLSAQSASISAERGILFGTTKSSDLNQQPENTSKVSLEAIIGGVFWTAEEGISLHSRGSIQFGNSEEDPSGISLKGKGDQVRSGVEFSAEGTISWKTDGVGSIGTQDQSHLEIQGPSEFKVKDTLQILSSNGDLDIDSHQGSVLIQSDGDLLLEGTLSLRDHSDGLNHYNATSIRWESLGGIWSVEAYQILEQVNGTYSIQCEEGGALFQGEQLDFSFGKGLSLKSGKDIQFSAGEMIEVSVQEDFVLDVIQNANLSLAGEFSGIEFLGRNTTMEFLVGDLIGFHGTEGLSWLGLSLEGRMTLESDSKWLAANENGKISLLSLEEFLVEAGSAEFSSGEMFRIVSRDSSSIDTQGEFLISLKDGMSVETQLNSKGMIEFKSDSFLVDSQNSLVSFEASGGQFHCEGSGGIQIDAFEAHFISEGKNSSIILEAKELFSISTESLLASSGSHSFKTGTLLSAEQAKWTSTQNSTFSLWTNPTNDLKERSPITFAGDQLSFTSGNQIAFFAGSGRNSAGETSPDPNLGMIQFTSSDMGFAFKSEAQFSAENSLIQLDSRGDVLFSSEDLMLMNTHHEKSGIRLEAKQFDFSKVTERLEISAGRKALFSTESGILGFEISDLFSIRGVGPGAAVQMKTISEGSRLEILSKTSEWVSDLIQIKSEGDLTVKSNSSQFFSTNTNNPGSKISVIAQGVNLFGELQDSNETTSGIEHLFHPGLLIDSSEIDISSKELEMNAAGGIVFGSANLDINVANFLIESVGDVELGFGQMSAENISFAALSEGIEVFVNGKGLEFHSEEKFQIVGGLWGGKSAIKISSKSSEEGSVGELIGNYFTADQNIDAVSDSNILLSSKEKISGMTETVMNFEAIRGDILFRSITMDQPSGQVEGPFDLLVEARSDEGVIRFAPKERMGHLQVCYELGSKILNNISILNSF